MAWNEELRNYNNTYKLQTKCTENTTVNRYYTIGTLKCKLTGDFNINTSEAIISPNINVNNFQNTFIQ